jgi:hypothetical protein
MAARPLFQLGSFQFDLPNGAPQTLDRDAEYRWELIDRISREPAAQFIGPGRQEITLEGTLYPGLTGRQSTLETLRTLAATGQPQMLSDGLGKVYGRWALTRVREGQAVFAPGGGARKVGFTLSLVRYGEDRPGQAASPSSTSATSNPSAVSTVQQALNGVTAQTGAGSAFKALDWATSTAGNAARGAGLQLGQIGAITASIANRDYVGAALNAFGLSNLSGAQQSVWAQLGINAAQLGQQMLQGRAAPTIAVALDALRPATTAMLQTLGGGAQGGAALANLVRDASTIGTMLDVDPRITEAVRQVIRP